MDAVGGRRRCAADRHRPRSRGGGVTAKCWGTHLRERLQEERPRRAEVPERQLRAELVPRICKAKRSVFPEKEVNDRRVAKAKR